MFKWLGSRYFWGAMFIIIGGIFLLQYFGLITLGALLWAIIIASGGVLFLSIFFAENTNWWALIPGVTLISVAIVIAIGSLLPDLGGELGGLVILGGIGLSFILVYLVQRENWWAIIPGGVMLSIGAIVGLESFLPGAATGGLFLIGLGATFAVLALVPTPQGKMQWALIPAGILAVIGLVLLVVSADIFRIVGAVGLIVLGGFILYRNLRRE